MTAREQSVETPAQLCQPELLSEEASSHDPQLQAALSTVGVTPQGMAMTPSQRDAMQQQMQMLQEYMMPMYKYQSAYQRHIDMNHTARLPQEKPYRCEVCGQFFKYLKSFHKHRANHSAIDRILNTSDDSATGGMAEFPRTSVGMAPPPPTVPQGLSLKEVAEESNSITITAIKTERPDTPPAGGSHEPQGAPTDQETLEHAAAMQGTDSQTLDASQGGEKSWICPYCLKGFKGKENLKLHIRTHTGEKPYECNVCFRRFARGDYLSKHMVTHSQGSSPQPGDEFAGSPPDGSTAAKSWYGATDRQNL
ncbi:Zinc finger protein 865 [Amphibalanus amphitrite]|uniref:Zinc finger protein 865 n=1 Tax=Amphibalanus amphitrite TaxID=1232801 RepID=A0A6A4V9G1_AMPAM|nr:Zinc finger protein 865 [Amphibalanus amphitrite]